MIFDTHLHLVYLNRLSYPWIAGVPALNADSTYPKYEALAKRVGITGVFHMEVDVADEDRIAETDMVCELMQQPGSLMKGAIASCRPEENTFAELLDTQGARPEVMGFRRILHVIPDDVSQSSTFRDNVKRLSGTGLTFDICMFPHQLGLAAELVDHCPDVKFVLDHCGVPDVKSGAMSPWAEHMTELAKRENVTAKISGVVAYGDPDTWTLGDIRPYVEHTIEAFGWDRVVWGSDSPVCTLGATLETWVAATHALLADCSADEKSALLYNNAQKLWNLS